MLSRSMISAIACAFSLSLAQGNCSFGAEPASPPVARVTAGIGSADKVLNFTEYLVSKLAGKKNTWTKTIQPNLEIFLIGVSTDQPIRFDLLFDKAHGSQTQAIIPTVDLKDFLVNNLDPIGIVTAQDKKDKNLYQCTGTVYEGWMRYIATPKPYSVFYAQKEFLPADLPHPQGVHQPLAAKGYLAFLHMQNAPAGLADRQAAFDAYHKNADKNFQKLSSETREQFELRKGLREETLSILKQWLSETANVEFGVNVDEAKGHLPTQLSFSALPGTALERDVKTLQETNSLYGAIEAPKNNVLTVRLNVPLNAERIPGVRKIYELARPVLKARIETNEKATPGEKAALQEIASSLLDVLTENLDSQKTIDGYLDVYPVKDKHAVVMSIAATGEAKFNEMAAKIPAAQEGWKIEMNADKQGETAIHKLIFGSTPPKSLVDFYGNSNVAWIGVNAKSVWLAGGEGALEELKKAITKTEAGPTAGKGVLLVAEMNARPIIESVDAIRNDPELDILKQVNPKGRRQERLKEARGKEPAKADEGKPGQKAASNLANFVWVPTALEALQGQEDRITLAIKANDDGTLVGQSDAQVGVLKAIGALVAKFADENLK